MEQKKERTMNPPKWAEDIGSWFWALITILIVLFLIWGIYWVFKTVSYELFYESMVENTIRELVKTGSLK